MAKNVKQLRIWAYLSMQYEKRYSLQPSDKIKEAGLTNIWQRIPFHIYNKISLGKI